MTDDTQTTGTPAAPDTTADTAATQASEADVQTNETPEATQEAEVQETEATEVKAEDTVEDKLYAGKYKSVEDLEKAYQNAESKLGQTTSEKAELARVLNEAFVTPAPADTDDSYEETDSDSQEIEGIKRNQAVLLFAMSHPDADGDSIKKVLTEDPLVAQITGHEAKLEYAYLRSKNMSQPKAIEEAQKQAVQATQAKIAEKQTAQVESARQSTPPNDNEELTQSELRDKLRSDEGFHNLVTKKFPGINKMTRQV